jgi:hypothetical protein
VPGTARSAWPAAPCSIPVASFGRPSAIEKQLKDEAERQRLWPQLMRQAGYRTCMTGKWHVSGVTRRPGVRRRAPRARRHARHLRRGHERPRADAATRGSRGTPPAAGTGPAASTGARSPPMTPSPSSKHRSRAIPVRSLSMPPSTRRTTRARARARWCRPIRPASLRCPRISCRPIPTRT